MRIIFIIVLITTTSFGQSKFQKDFEFYWKTMNGYFAYFDTQQIDWNKVKDHYQPIIDTITNENDFIRVLEMTNNELYNGHLSLNRNLASSSKVLPSGTDIWVSYQNNKFIITSIREGSSAQKLGIKLGMEILAINEVAMEQAIKHYLPKSIEKHTDAMYEYAANLVVAGTHNTKRKLKVNGALTFTPDPVTWKSNEVLIATKILDDNIGYIKINNSLGNNNTIKAFDQALDRMFDTKGIILDLRETPGGGNTTVARAIIGRFINKEQPYQIHSFPYEEKLYGVKRTTVELVSPRGKIYNNILVVLCGRWTGSMGEGITIGLNGMKRAKVVGTEMADLLGAVYGYEMPETKIGFQISGEKLFDVNRIPREDFVPKYHIVDTKLQLEKAIEIVNTSL